MTKYSRHGVIEEVALMIRTGASENSCSEYVENLLRTEQITSRVYEFLISMIIDNF